MVRGNLVLVTEPRDAFYIGPMIGSDFLQLDLTDIPPGARTDRLTQLLRQAVTDERLPVGTRLPATRVLADELGVARGTVAEAYRRLAEDGLLAARTGAGTHVATRPPATSPRPTPDGPDADPSAEESGLIDLATGVPDLTAFPRAAWLRAEREVLATATARDLGYAPPAGTARLRIELASWLARSRGVRANADQIVVTGGVTGALSLIAQVMRSWGQTTIGVENPGAHGNRRILDYWLPRLVPVPVDRRGIVVDTLPDDIDAVVVTPAHQYPTGVVLAPDRRRALIDWAARADAVIVEDDYDAEYRYDRQPVHALQPLDPQHVAYTASFSKTLAPGLRIGWLVVPPRWHGQVVELRWATDLGSPVLPQLVVAHLLHSGALERHLRVMRHRHRHRRDAALVALARHLPARTVGGIAAGLHLVIDLPDDADDVAVVGRARELGVLVQPLSAHYLTRPRPGLVLSYAAHHPAELDAAIERLARAVTGRAGPRPRSNDSPAQSPADRGRRRARTPPSA